MFENQPVKSNSQSAQKSKQKRTLLFIALACISPLVIAFIYHQLIQSGYDFGSRNQGLLLNQTITLEQLGIRPAGNVNEVNQSQWSVVMIADTNCSLHCRDFVEKSENLVLSLGKNTHRVQTLLLSADQYDDATLQFIQSQLIGALPLDDLGGAEQLSSQGFGHIWVADPLGRVILAYSSKQEPLRKVRRDLLILLKNSLIG